MKFNTNYYKEINRLYVKKMEVAKTMEKCGNTFIIKGKIRKQF